MRFIYFIVVLSGLAVFCGCNDGKFNLSLVLWSESEPEPPSNAEEPSSSSIAPTPSSSSKAEPLPSSSSEEPQPPPQSSSGRGLRSSSSLSQVEFPPPLIEDAPGVRKGFATRYWDGCKPHCSWPKNVENSEPWAICRNCDRDNNEMPAYFLHPDAGEYYRGEYLGTPNACDDGKNLGHEALWKRSPAYTKWKADNPAYPNSSAYTCWDMTPHIVNDTLAYAFAATLDDGVNRCGKCYQLQFDGGVAPNSGQPKDTHRALIGKTLIVLSSNTGGLDSPDQFDIMIPGGGLGDFDAWTEQIGVSKEDLGPTFGGLLSTCISGVDYYKTPMEVLQECVREECHRVFDSSIRARNFLDGCLFMANWYMAADNPTHVYKEVEECPKYLTDKYRSTIQTTEPPPLW